MEQEGNVAYKEKIFWKQDDWISVWTKITTTDTKKKEGDYMEEEIENVERMTPAQVAEKLHMGAEGVRAALRQDKFPFRYSF